MTFCISKLILENLKLPILIGYKKNYQKSVLEIKYDQSHLPNFKFINSLTSQFNLDLTKSSKFVQGILNLNLV